VDKTLLWLERIKMIGRPAIRSALTRGALAIIVCAALLAPLAPAQSQPARRPLQKRSLTHDDYDAWRSIQSQQLSRDGRFVAYALVPQDGDGEVVVRNLATGSEWRHPRGSRPDPAAQQESTGEPPPGRRRGAGQGTAGGQLSFTADSRAALFLIYPPKAEVEKAKKQRKRPEEMPKNSLGIMDLATGKVTVIERVRRFQDPEDAGGFVACLLEPKPEERRPEDRRSETAGSPPAERRRRERRKEYGSDLVLRRLADGADRVLADVADFAFSKDGKSLVFAVASKKEETNGVYLVEPGSAEAPLSLLSGPGKYTRLTWDDDNRRMAFFSDRDDASASRPKFKLYLFERGATAALEAASSATSGLKAGMEPSERGGISFSRDGSKIFFGVSQPGEPEKDQDEEPAEEKVVADLWHWKDDYIQPMQKVRADQERNRSYRAVYHVDGKKCLQLADPSMAVLTPPDDGSWALGSDNRAYRRLVGIDTDYSDYYLVNIADGTRKRVLDKQAWSPDWSPAGTHAVYYDGRDWNSLSVPDGRITNLTRNLGVSFSRETHDSPGAAPSYGMAGWTSDGKYVLLYDRYDIWQISPDGAAKHLTDGVGRKEKIEFRYVSLEPPVRGRDRVIDSTRPLLLSAENEESHDSGFYSDRIDGGMPVKLIMAAKNFSDPVKAKDADVLLFTATTFEEFPDLLVSGSDFKKIKKVSDANPQKSELLWGKAELVGFKNSDGMTLSSILIKPENFDPSKKYPMIVYIYERLSQGLHRFVDPRPGHSINASYYASNGYLVLMPDIAYTIGYPGQSAMKCVLPAIQAVVDKGYVNEAAIGIQGHSWGGYQIAYMITQTNRFRAASAGAPVANMTSAYSGIRWGTGLPRQFQYEKTQSRIGGSLWDYPMRFIENSPVFRADRVQTPLLMLHNDNDDAVPWYQGIEYFLALRRLGKEVYLYNYNGEPHGLRKRVNQRDYAMRLQQFFDHYLKGAPAPDWMDRGIPYLEREKEKEKYRPVPADVREKAQK
jgi:dipeptidyl aminopeptidase/acylaminoacyl peptidase